MKWWQTECKYGDMIRISLGGFYHYGIFVSESEILQFGLPPIEGLLNRKVDNITVCVTDIDAFSAGNIVEVATVEKGDKLKRLPPKKTVARAKERIGEGNYNLLHNNCEHFARYCYFGEKRCEQTEILISDWQKKFKSDVYFSVIPDIDCYGEVYPSEKNEEILSVNNQRVKAEKYWAWKTLEYALFRTFGYKIANLDISKQNNGKWICKDCCFSISHSNGVVAVALSKEEIGIDIESVENIANKFCDKDVFEKFLKRTLNKKDTKPKGFLEFTKLWTKKESIYKAQGRAVLHLIKSSLKTATPER